MGIHAFNPNTWKVEVRTLPRVQGQPVPHSIRLDTATLQNPVSTVLFKFLIICISYSFFFKPMRLNYLFNDGKYKETRANAVAQWVKAFAVD